MIHTYARARTHTHTHTHTHTARSEEKISVKIRDLGTENRNWDLPDKEYENKFSVVQRLCLFLRSLSFVCLFVCMFLSFSYLFENRLKEGFKIVPPSVCTCDRPAEHKVLETNRWSKIFMRLYTAPACSCMKGPQSLCLKHLPRQGDACTWRSLIFNVTLLALFDSTFLPICCTAPSRRPAAFRGSSSKGSVNKGR